MLLNLSCMVLSFMFISIMRSRVGLMSFLIISFGRWWIGICDGDFDILLCVILGG